MDQPTYIPISDLPPIAEIDDDSLILVTIDGVSYKMTGTVLKEYVEDAAAPSVEAAAASAVAAAASETAAQSAQTAAESASTTATSAATSASASAQTATSASSAAVSANTAAQSAKTAAETAQGKAEDAQNAAEAAAEQAEQTLQDYAKVDGAYETLTAGNAEQLLATQYVEDSVPYIFRPSGNHADIGDREFDTLVGGSIVWNQLMPTFSAATTGTSQQQFIQVAGQNDVFTVGHKYFVRVDVTSLSDYADCRMRYPSVRYLFAGRNQFIVDATNANFAIELESSDGSDVQLSLPANYAMACDLTLMFGSAVADYIYNLELAGTSAGVAYLLNLIPLLGGDYMPQNSGTMLSVNASAHETVGFNQWDEEWENGAYNGTTGAPVANANKVRNKNPIPVIPGATYFVQTPIAGTNIYYYDASLNFISVEGVGQGATFTVPNDARYINFSTYGTTYTTYNNDICINLSWNGTRNGEYEPYEKRTYPLDNTVTLRGVLMVENSKVKCDGDIYNADGPVERWYKQVTLTGAENWTLAQNLGDYVGFTTPTTDGNTTLSNRIRCDKFITLSGWVENEYVRMAQGRIAVVIAKNRLSAVTVDAFKAWLNANNLNVIYLLAESTTETATPYQSPQIVDDWGTERYVDYEYSIGQRPIPVPVGHETKYPANLRDKVQHLPGLADSDGTYAIQQVGTQMTLVPLPVVIPEPPSANGTYTLKATVSGGAVTLSWEV